MKPFINENFLLQSKTAKTLYNSYAVKMPIIDFHNHLNPKDIYEDRIYNNITEIWLEEDHYKWRAMRAYGIHEDIITGAASPYDKFLAWSETVQNLIGNPLYHWTHLELKNYFGIDTLLSPESADVIWKECNQKLNSPSYSIRNLLRMQNIEVLCTTDDPIDDLEYHKKLKNDNFQIKVLPTFRPDKALGIEKEDFNEYIQSLGRINENQITNISDLIHSLKKRLLYFIENGCFISDHSIEDNFLVTASKEEVNTIFENRLSGRALTSIDCAKYRGFLLKELAFEYSRNNITMQLHIGALRDNSTRILNKVGINSGIDSMNDFNYAESLSSLLNSLDINNELPKTILYCLNPKDLEMLSTMCGNFQSNNNGIKGKVQLGAPWWFSDNKLGIENHIDILSSTGVLSTFVGMLTDSRSFISFPRHEYFRRILCNKIGILVDNGEYPADFDYLGKLIKNICYYNSKNYFGI
ncbi:glucuronate isomerase [Clostridium sp. AL.422]|uniref:glucuronate isomerase n=1 Tax=Clostridium TaxID=1485 RepID=UPI00293DFED1|nr:MULTISPECIES: glucuronate isomerase [unclassified Clostridium]MDV4151557.1 glucuronate isomerase [Clostridium sp. AL.422]